jgi:Fungalysin/Thermolysin Propeptide Motif
MLYKSHCRSFICLLALGFLSFGWLWLRHSPVPKEATKKSFFTTASIPLGSTSHKLVPRALGTLPSFPSNKSVLAAKALLSGSAPTASQIPAPPLASRALPIPDNLRPKQPKLSDTQRRNLAKLRWGPSKSLRYSGDPVDATMRLLSAPALILPLDPSNPVAESPEALTHRFLAENRELLLIKSPASEFSLVSSEADPQGGSILRFGQRLGQYEVWPGQLTANVSSAG